MVDFMQRPGQLRRETKQSLFPKPSLRDKLHSLGIGFIFHEHASLLAMVESRTGRRMDEDSTPDQLAEMLIEAEKGKPTLTGEVRRARSIEGKRRRTKHHR
jgi:hypothetical protein